MLKGAGNITCLAKCPDGTYGVDSSYKHCVECSAIDEHCVKCHNLSDRFECMKCEQGYVVNCE